MAAFEFVALDAAGKQKKGVLEADSVRQVRSQLRDRGWVPVEVEHAAEKAPLLGRRRNSPSVSVSELALVSRQLATLIGSGMPLDECLLAVSEQTEQKKLRTIFIAVRSKVLEGYSLAKALSEFPRAFDRQFIASIDAGEQSGHLDVVMAQLADYIQDRHAMQQKMQNAGIYPAAIVVIALAIVIFLIVNVIPNITESFSRSGQALPPLTEALINVSDFFINYWMYLIAAIIAAIFSFTWWNKDEKRRTLTHRMYLRLPVVGWLSRGFATYRYASTLSMLTGSGIPLVEAMRIASVSVENIPIRQAVEQAMKSVSEGANLSSALRTTGFFSPMMLYMIASGEESGELEQMLKRAAQSQEMILRNTIDRAMSLMQPFTLILMGLIVLIIVLAVIVPLSQMSTMM